MSKLDGDACGTIVFDETLRCCVRKLAKARRCCKSHPEKIVVATGDSR